MASQLEIFNNALILLGAPPVISPTQNIRSAQAIMSVYDSVKKGELRKKPAWNFSIKLANLNTNAISPTNVRPYSYPLPSDFIGMAPQFPEVNYNTLDWLIQDSQIYTAMQNGSDLYGDPLVSANGTAGPPILPLRYVANVDEGLFDPLFALCLSAALASMTCEAITQSNSKLQSVEGRYRTLIDEAKKANAFDNVPMKFPVDPWISVRL